MLQTNSADVLMESMSDEKPKKMTHDERRERRRQIAAAIRSGRTVPEVVKDFKVGMETIRLACVEYGVRVDTRRSSPPVAA